MTDKDADSRHDQADAWDREQRSYALHWLAENEPGAFTRMAAAVRARSGDEDQS